MLPQLFYNLTSENEGPSFFNVTLVINEENMKLIQFEAVKDNGKFHIFLIRLA